MRFLVLIIYEMIITQHDLQYSITVVENGCGSFWLVVAQLILNNFLNRFIIDKLRFTVVKERIYMKSKKGFSLFSCQAKCS